MPDTPLNPAVVWNLRALADEGTRELRHVVLEPDLLHKLLDVAEAVQRVREFLEYRKANSAVARDGLRALDGDGRG